MSFPGLTLPLFKSCRDYGAYHFFGLSIHGPFAYVVLPAACATNAGVPFESLTGSASHELVEAMTDPIITQGWIDDSFSGLQLFKDAEAEDLCAPQTGTQQGTTAVIPNTQVELDPYWSNADGKCVTP